ncbi:MAG: cytochrome c biogenesis protein CcdA [Sandaracinaceae bacterium]
MTRRSIRWWWPARARAAVVLMVAGTAHADWLTDLTSPFEAALAEGSWGPVLGIMFAAGLLTSLTPCVYPMIAITVSIFGASQAKSKLHGAGLSTMYVLGMCALFTPLGLIVGLTGGVFGDFLGNPWIVIPLAVFFVVMATSMFGAFELSLPPSLQNKLAQMGGLGPKGAFTLGLVGGLIAAPCTGPVLGGLLAWITTTQNAALGGAALFAYSVGLGLPTWLVGTFAISLPKSGRWLEWVKSVFGIVMVAAALWFLRAFIPVGSGTVSDYIQRTPTWLMIAAGLLVVGLAAGAVHLSYHGADKLTITRKSLGIAMSTLGLVLLAIWLGAPPPGARIAWLDDYEAARERAESQNKPLLVDFGASWCGACEELDSHTFSDPRVVSAGQRFVAVRLDLSRRGDPGYDVLAQYDQRGLPLVVLHHSDGEEAGRVTSFVEAERMLQLMREVR